MDDKNKHQEIIEKQFGLETFDDKEPEIKPPAPQSQDDDNSGGSRSNSDDNHK